MKLALWLLCLGLAVSAAHGQGEGKKVPHDPAHEVKIVVGDLTVVVGDHHPHGGCQRPNYTGIHHLSHRQRASNVFCPLYAGMIGVRRPCGIEAVAADGAMITVGTGSNRTTELHVVKAPHYIDYTATFTAGGSTAWWNNTSYMNGPADPGVYLVKADGTWTRHYSKPHGNRASAAPATMKSLPPIQKTPNPKYPHGNSRFWDGFSDLRFDPRYPLYYGRFDHMVLVFMTDRKWGDSFIPYTSPSGGGFSKEWNRINPAWDFRYWLRGLKPKSRIAIRSRLCYKPFVSQQDVLDEYEAWLRDLPAQ